MTGEILLMLPSYLPPQLPLSSCRLPLLLRGRRSISPRKVSLLPSLSDFKSSVKTTKKGRLEISTCYASGNCIKIKEEKTKTLHSSARLVCKHSEEEKIDWAIKIKRRTWTRRHPTAELVMIRRRWIEKRRTVYANDVEWALSEFGIYFRKQIYLGAWDEYHRKYQILVQFSVNFINFFKIIPQNQKKAFKAFKIFFLRVLSQVLRKTSSQAHVDHEQFHFHIP